jgi:hypothetical protein
VAIAAVDLNQPVSLEFPMKIFSVSAVMMVAGVLIAAPVFAQLPSKQKTDGDSPTIVGPGSAAYKQKTDGDSPTIVGPGSEAFKQKTDGDSPTIVGPGSEAFKQKTQSLSHSDPNMGLAKQN